MALAISFIYLTNYKDFLVIYSRVDSGVERGGWSDPNYLGCTVGMGVMAALVLLMNRATSNFFYSLIRNTYCMYICYRYGSYDFARSIAIIGVGCFLFGIDVKNK